MLPLNLEAEVFTRWGLKLHNFLGASECGGIAYDRSSVPRSDPALVGEAMVGVRLACAADGRLEVRGGSVGTGIWPEPSENLSAGRFVADDLAEIGPDGRVFLRGRAGDVINVAGRKVMPEVIEMVLRTHPDVRECLVLGLPAEVPRGEAIAAVVGGSPDLDETSLRDFLLTRLPAWQVPRHRFLEPALTPSHRGKLSRAEWRQRLARQAPEATDAADRP